MASELLYVADEPYASGFSEQAADVDVVCVGDSITGWNNFGRRQNWPFPTYPEFLQQLCQDAGIVIADGGVAGEVSGNGLQLVQEYLGKFPNAPYFVVGFGTNDLALSDNLEETSRRILDSYAAMVDTITADSRSPLVLNVPNANERLFTPAAVADLRNRRDYHNERLTAFCAERDLKLVDIRSHLRDEHFGDELHPNEQGARVIADSVFAGLSQVLEHDKRTN